MDYEYDDDTDSYTVAADDTGEHEMRQPFETNSVVTPNYGGGYYLVLGHIWWNCEQTFAYYLVRCDENGNILDGAEPQYQWWDNSCTVVKAPAIPDAA